MKHYVEHELVPVRGLKGESISQAKRLTGKDGKDKHIYEEKEENNLSRQNVLVQAKRIAESIYHPVGKYRFL